MLHNDVDLWSNDVAHSAMINDIALMESNDVCPQGKCCHSKERK